MKTVVAFFWIGVALMIYAIWSASTELWLRFFLSALWTLAVSGIVAIWVAGGEDRARHL